MGASSGAATNISGNIQSADINPVTGQPSFGGTGTKAGVPSGMVWDESKGWVAPSQATNAMPTMEPPVAMTGGRTPPAGFNPNDPTAVQPIPQPTFGPSIMPSTTSGPIASAYNGGTTPPPRGQEGNWTIDVSQGSPTNGQWIPSNPSSAVSSAPATLSSATSVPQIPQATLDKIANGSLNLTNTGGNPSSALNAYNAASTAATAPTSGFNVNTASAEGLQKAMAGTEAEMGYRPQQVQAPVASASGYTGQGYKPATMSSTGYSATAAGSQGYRPATMTAGQLANTNLSAYMNPYESAVIGGLQSDALRGQQMASNQLGAQATAAKAFGGSRQAIAEGQMAGDIQNQLNNQIAGLRQTGYQNAQQMALADIQNRMTAGQTNVNALNQAGQFGAGAANTAALANAAAANQAKQFTAGAMNTAAGQNQAAINAAGQFGAGAANTANQFNAGAQNAATLANQQAMLSAQFANQNAGLAGSQQRLGAASQMGNLSNLGFGMGQTLNQNLAQQGALQQALQQMVMDKAAAQYAGYQQSPYTALSAATSALGATPTVGTSTTSQQRGLFDYLGLGASVYPFI
jgi:hypothetical protein